MFFLELEVVRDGRMQRQRFPMEERGKVLIGRHECDLLLNDRSVSRKHLGFAVRDGKLIAGDLKSTAGTRHNGKELKQAFARKGDVFEVGPFLVRVRKFEKAKDKAPEVVKEKRAAVPQAVNSEWILPLVGGAGFRPRSIGCFYRSFLSSPRAAWTRLPQDLERREVFQALPAHAFFAVWLRWGTASKFGLGPDLMALANVGIWWMVGLLALGVGLSQFLLPALQVRVSWGKGMAFALALSALWMPVALAAGIAGSEWPLSPVVWAVVAAWGVVGFGTTFRPSRRRVWAFAAATAALALVVGGTLLMAPRIKRGPASEDMAAFAPPTYDYASEEPRVVLSPKQAGLE